MSAVKWIKISTSIYDSKKIKQIRKLPNGDSIVLLWVFLLCLAGDINEDGLIQLTEDIPYTDEMLSDEFRMELNTIRLGLDTFEKFRMIQYDNVGKIQISNWQEYQNIDGLTKIKEQNRTRQQRFRDKNKLLLESNVTDNVT